jgi:ATP sulfurylase
MKPVKFKESNIEFAKNQDEYETLPAYYDPEDKNGIAITCWKMNFFDRIRAVFSGKVFIALWTFNHGFSPMLSTMNKKEFF